jgi:hypothetical protein
MKNNKYNLYKSMQADVGATVPALDSSAPSAQSITFADANEVNQKLYDAKMNKTWDDVVNAIKDLAPNDEKIEQNLSDALQKYYDLATEDPTENANTRLEIATEINEIINPEKESNIMQAPVKKASVQEIIETTNADIEKFANSISTQKLANAKPFNLMKSAQAHAANRVDFINYGPADKQYFPYSNTGYVGSKWHTWIRAKDHNFLFDDTAVDFETFWRGNIMDKYSRPYRNDAGEWVGGYMNKRFEVDRNIPEGNNLMLLPGQKRRPYMPEWATWEARMTAARSKYAEERGYSPTDTESKPTNLYNWEKSATVKKK